MPLRYTKWILVNKNLPEHVTEWLNMQSDKTAALKYLIYKDIYRNGVRDIFYTDDKVYGTEEVGTLYGSVLDFHENGNFGAEVNPEEYDKNNLPPAHIYNRNDAEDLKLEEDKTSNTADFYNEN